MIRRKHDGIEYKSRNKTLNRARFIPACAFLISVHNTLANSRVVQERGRESISRSNFEVLRFASAWLEHFFDANSITISKIKRSTFYAEREQNETAARSQNK